MVLMRVRLLRWRRWRGTCRGGWRWRHILLRLGRLLDLGRLRLRLCGRLFLVLVVLLMLMLLLWHRLLRYLLVDHLCGTVPYVSKIPSASRGRLWRRRSRWWRSCRSMWRWFRNLEKFWNPKILEPDFLYENVEEFPRRRGVKLFSKN